MVEFDTTLSPTTNNDSNGMDIILTNSKDINEVVIEEAMVVGESNETGDREEALETHEVVEINKFTEKKEWIEEKIKFLENMPPIEVFAGIDAFIEFSEEMPPGLPTRLELDQWLEEHEAIEKQTEIFDAEDMSKLKMLTKAATQRNLSPEDTDLIELTLTTLLALDKLLHLLRDRSDLLDLLGLRLTWEEQRIMSWKERRLLLDDLEVFLSTRARWSLETYELPIRSSTPGSRFDHTVSPPPPHPSFPSPARRRDSVASISSDSSVTTLSPTFSRGARYRLAEALSHDAAVLSGRFTSLNHHKVRVAGKTLDRLIDASRMPVPDRILDEQDRLEDKADTELETVGKFAMAVVVQWKRADEFYNDTMKDQSTAQTLLSELNSAKLQHPNPRLDSAFMTRAQALTKRVVFKADPALRRSSFPRPMHPLFPDQAASNSFIVKTLSAELAEAVKLAHQSETAAQEYHQSVEAVKRAEMLQDRMQTLSGQLGSIANTMINGVPGSSEQGDLSPLDLETETCLDRTRHAAFIMHLSSVVQEFTKVDRAAEEALREGNFVSSHMKSLLGTDPGFKEQLLTVMQELEVRKNATENIKLETLASTERLKDARNLWQALNDIMDLVEDNERAVMQEMDCQRWNALKCHRSDLLTTPGAGRPSGISSSASSVTPVIVSSKLDALSERLKSSFNVPFDHLVPTLEKPISIHLQGSYNCIVKYMGNIRSLIHLWENILSQTQAMTSVQAEAHELIAEIDTLTADIIVVRQSILDANASSGQVPSHNESKYGSQVDELQSSVRSFIDLLPTRLTFVSPEVPGTVHPRTDVLTHNAIVGDHQLNRFKDAVGMTLPFNLSTLDNAIRDEGNVLALNASSKIQYLRRNFEYLHIAHLVKFMDKAIKDLTTTLNTSEDALSQLQLSFDSLPLSASQELGTDTALSDGCATMIEQCHQLAQLFQGHDQACTQGVQTSLHTLQSAPGAQDSSVYDTLVLPRVKAAEEVLRRTKDFSDAISEFQEELTRFKEDEDARLTAEHERLETEARTRIQKDKEEEELQRQAEEVKKEEELRRQMEEGMKQEALQRRTESVMRQEVAWLQEKANIEGVEVSDPKTPEEDVFGSKLAPSESTNKSASDVTAVRARIMSLRNRLRSLRIGDLAHPQAGWTTALPTSCEASEIQATLSQLDSEALNFRKMITDSIVNSELQLFQADLKASHTLVERVTHMAMVSDQVTACDNAFSDLLEHVDLYPSIPPVQSLASSHVSDEHLPSEEQLKHRLAFSKKLLEDMNHRCFVVADDPRVISEQTRLQQTWSELLAICIDRLNGDRSRPASTASSSGRSTGTPRGPSDVKQTRGLGGNGPRRIPRESITSRSPSSAATLASRPGTNMSIRSVSGPSGSSSLFNTTFASRQRTTSLASISSSNDTSPFKRPVSPNRPHLNAKWSSSPTFSETSNRFLASTPSRSTWARAPRQSFGELQGSSRQSFGELSRNFPSQGSTGKRKAYIANPKSKLDVAVGQVVNNFRLPVTVQVAGDGWKDQSGNYWIGDADPKLCFCRILRSQTVMVRVGGGWCELSKFLKGHFADLLAELPPSPPRNEEQWISSNTIQETMTSPSSTVQSPSTPEPKTQTLLPSLQIFTPSGTSPQSIKTTSSPGASPGLTPLQYLRRADVGLRPITPLPKTPRSKISVTPNTIITPSRTSIWRP